MVYVPTGGYWRGLDPDQIDHIVDRMRAQQLNIDFDSVKDILSKEARADIQLPAFHIGETPVTNSQFAQFADETGYRTTAEHTGAETTWRNYRAEQPDNPVVHVSVHDAEAYCKWAGLSLATVDEWRRAYRGDDRRIYPWGDEFDAGKCNTAESCKGMETTPVRQFGRGRSPFG